MVEYHAVCVKFTSVKCGDFLSLGNAYQCYYLLTYLLTYCCQWSVIMCRAKQHDSHWPSFAVTMLLPRLLNAADLDSGDTMPSSVTPQRFAGCN